VARNENMKIDLMIIGVEKAGTTALFRHLAQSPHVFSHKQREMFYFLSDLEYRRGWEYAADKYFVGYCNEFVLAKNVMQINSREAMVRLKKQFPGVKCIVMLREPAARAFSAFNYARLRGAENCQTFEEALKLEENRFMEDPSPNNPLLYLRNSTYAPKLNTAFEVYGRDNLMVVSHEEYKSDPIVQLSRVEEFVGRNILEGANIELNWYNRAAKARFSWLSKWLYRILKSNNPVRRSLRAMLPHDKAAKLRHTVLNFNRVEAPYEPINGATANMIRSKLSDDRAELIKILGYCPW
jgi:hypothetical protein